MTVRDKLFNKQINGNRWSSLWQAKLMLLEFNNLRQCADASFFSGEAVALKITGLSQGWRSKQENGRKQDYAKGQPRHEGNNLVYDLASVPQKDDEH